jgi:acyl-coenzyme A synthetase/AMP-(fatty) acid ligase
VLNFFKKAFPKVDIQDTYGSTECGTIFSTSSKSNSQSILPGKIIK